MKRFTSLFAIVVIGSVIVLPTACSLPQSTTKPVYYYTIDYEPEHRSIEEPALSVIRVNRFTAAPPFNSQRIIYGDKGLHRNAYARFKWIAEPGEILSYALTRDLQQTKMFQAVLAPSSATPPTHTVQGWIEEFIEEDYTDPAQASVKISMTLIDARQPDPVQRILFQKNYHAKSPCADKTPAALSQAMSLAVKELFKQVSQDIYGALTNSVQSQAQRR